MTKKSLNTIFQAFFFFILVHLSPLSADSFTLDNIRKDIKQDYKSLGHLSYQEFLKMLKAPEDLVIFDVREASEYQVSHIAGAVRVDPGIWNSTFLSRHGQDVKNKTVIFYCSVGRRSSRLANRVQTKLKELGAKSVYNLDGGVFAWHNQKLDLQNARGKTPYVHPFSSRWSKLLIHQKLLRMKL